MGEPGPTLVSRVEGGASSKSRPTSCYPPGPWVSHRRRTREAWICRTDTPNGSHGLVWGRARSFRLAPGRHRPHPLPRLVPSPVEHLARTIAWASIYLASDLGKASCGGMARTSHIRSRGIGPPAGPPRSINCRQHRGSDGPGIFTGVREVRSWHHRCPPGSPPHVPYAARGRECHPVGRPSLTQTGRAAATAVSSPQGRVSRRRVGPWNLDSADPLGFRARTRGSNARLGKYRPAGLGGDRYTVDQRRRTPMAQPHAAGLHVAAGARRGPPTKLRAELDPVLGAHAPVGVP